MCLLGLSLLCSKVYLLFFPEFPKILTHYSYFIPISSPIIPTYSCNFNFIVPMIIIPTIHMVTYIRELDVVIADFSSESAWNIAAFKYIFTIIIFLNNLRDYFITFTHCNFQLFLYYARECPIIPELFALKLQPIILKIMPAY